MFIEWKKEYMVGHSMVDFDHQTLVNITNELFNRVSEGFSDEEIAQTISCLVDYVNRHFDREEELFMDSDYPGKDEHLSRHDDIRKTVNDIATAYKANSSAINIDEVLEFLKKWLTNHIMRADKGYIPYVV
ncbi:MAG: bacteriohemerythrin [Rhodospirillaceae bacterium]|nr:bacteriohemerythrin [Rhodospirillaceae bacterium]